LAGLHLRVCFHVLTYTLTVQPYTRDARGCSMSTGSPDLRGEGRVLLTEHTDFVLLNLYAPNAGDRPQRARLDFKLRWFRALQEKLDQLSAANRAVVVAGDLNIPRSQEDVHASMKWDGLYSDEVWTHGMQVPSAHNEGGQSVGLRYYFQTFGDALTTTSLKNFRAYHKNYENAPEKLSCPVPSSGNFAEGLELVR
jgi:hypothetical protein